MQNSIVEEIIKETGLVPEKVAEAYPDEIYIEVRKEDFKGACLALHTKLSSPVMMMFVSDEIQPDGVFKLYSVFEAPALSAWYVVSADIPAHDPRYTSLSREIFSASLFEREIREMFGLEPVGSPDTRTLCLHDEVWGGENYPLRKDCNPNFGFNHDGAVKGVAAGYIFKQIDGEGVFQVPVGPVHAGIIGPGHFRFSVAGEPIINLEIRLGFKHRGIEKLFEGKDPVDAVRLSECVSGVAVSAHSMAFCHALEKISRVAAPPRAVYIRNVFLELERMYNHAADIGGIAVDVGFSYPAAFASLIKESLLALNETLTGSRYLKGANTVGGVTLDISVQNQKFTGETLASIAADFKELKKMLLSSVSFMRRVDTAGALNRKIAEDAGIVGLPARACGIARDLRRDFPGPHRDADFKLIQQGPGDVLARLMMRIEEFEESLRLARVFLERLPDGDLRSEPGETLTSGCALGYVEGWRGPVLYWVKLDRAGKIERCKIVDPSFHNWTGLSYAVRNNIIPDFPLCNKSFNLSYSGNDL